VTTDDTVVLGSASLGPPDPERLTAMILDRLRREGLLSAPSASDEVAGDESECDRRCAVVPVPGAPNTRGAGRRGPRRRT
jgi:hypothetical protein